MADTTGGAARRVLVLSASAGAGHLRAADALLKDFQRHPCVAEVQHWDMLKYTTAMFRHIYSKVYLDLVNKAPKVLGYVYEKTDTPWKHEGRRLAFEKFNALPFIKALKAYQPDLVVSTHFTPPFLISALYGKKKVHVKSAVVITDMDVHGMWLVRHYLHYFCALDEAKAYLERMGISPNRITVSGIPVDPVFRVPKARHAAQARLGLDPDRFTLLVSAGGFGVGPITAMLEELLRLPFPAQVVAIAGRSAELKAKIETLSERVGPTARVCIVPVGFTQEMDEYMAAADLLISKPGGLTTSEAMARGLPMVVANPIPGQEERNSDHLLEAGVAIRCNTLATLAYKIERLATDPGRLEGMQARARAFGKPDAGRTIVDILLSSEHSGEPATIDEEPAEV